MSIRTQALLRKPIVSTLLLFLAVVSLTLLIMSPFIVAQRDTPSDTQTTYVESELFGQSIDTIEYVGKESDQTLGPKHSVYNVSVDNQHYRVKVYNEELNGQYRTDIEPWTNTSQ